MENIEVLFPEFTPVLERVMNHEFDLLGSGWVHVHHNMGAKGILGVKYSSAPSKAPTVGALEWIQSHINRSNKRKSASIWKHLEATYKPIDWHLDFKSGYRWDSRTWWLKIPYGHKPGVDIKVPWEISRCQHLPWLAMGFGKTKEKKYAVEFQNQILDFVATNPPRYGVNWRCAMDVAIRASNWILSYEWFRLYGYQFEETFNKVFSSSLFAHGHFIFDNLEIGKDNFRGNHYLADVCGLAYISSFLPESHITTRWFEFSYKALNEEMDYQFHMEGSNFEGSTSYHRLSAEMMLYTSLVFHLKGKTFPQHFLSRLSAMAEFSKAITRPDGNIVQIGDCDNGRFFKIQPIFKEDLIENHLTHFCLVDSIESLRSKTHKPVTSEGRWLQSLNFQLPFQKRPLQTVELNTPLAKELLPAEVVGVIQDISRAPLSKSKILDVLNYPSQVETFPLLSKHPLELSAYPQFGLYIWRNEDSFFSFRCGPVGQKGRGGHDHNDQLSIEFYDNHSLILFDPGTAIYTPFPELRNQYRSILAHKAPLVKDRRGKIVEPGPLDQGLFSLKGEQHSYILMASEQILIGYNPKIQVLRILTKFDGKIEVTDVCTNAHMSFVGLEHRPPTLSDGYGDVKLRDMNF